MAGSILTATEDGLQIRPDTKNIEAILKLPEPTSIKQMRGFLGMTNYMAKHIRGYASLSEPLVNLTR